MNRDKKKETSVIAFDKFEKPKNKYFTFHKTLFGKLVKIDSESKEVWFRLLNGKSIKSKISSEDVIKYRKHIAEEVKIIGDARISGLTLDIVSFKLSDLVPLKISSIEETINILKDIVR